MSGKKEKLKRKMSKICIYCKETDPAKFTGKEHVLPKSFGTFASQTPTLICVCDSCNQFFSKELDQILARETIEGVTRYRKGMRSGEARKQKDMKFFLDEGPETGEFGGIIIEGVDGTTGQLKGPASQVWFFNFKTQKWDKFLKEEIKGLKLSTDIYKELGKFKIKTFAPSPEKLDEVIKELRDSGINYQETNRFNPSFVKDGKIAENLQLPVVVEGKIDKVRKRGIVKILFNFAAHHLGGEEVLKKDWDKARQFVRFGGETLLARKSTKPFWNGQETDKMRFSSDSYNLRLENQDKGLVGVIQFFNLFTYEFILVEDYSIPPEKEVAYRFTPGHEPVIGIKMDRPAM